MYNHIHRFIREMFMYNHIHRMITKKLLWRSDELAPPPAFLLIFDNWLSGDHPVAGQLLSDKAS